MPKAASLPTPVVATRRQELVTALAPYRAAGRTIGFVPTMGALHDGHASLLDVSRERNEVSVLSIFVNPKQFGPKEDLSQYPRTFANDLSLAKERGVDVIFAPTLAEMYPAGFLSHARVEGMADVLCGAFRPGHFDGVCTVVLLLLNIVGAREAYFGLKDFQQYAILRRLCADLAHPTTLVGLPTVRDVDGLALSSRNRFLEADARARAVAVPRALGAAARAWLEGERDAGRLEEAARAVLAAAAFDAPPQYCELRTTGTLASVTGSLPEDGEGVVLACAQMVGSTRLIDNVVLADDAFHRGLLEDLIRSTHP
jgi:pantoate--beta-alanine ligase